MEQKQAQDHLYGLVSPEFYKVCELMLHTDPLGTWVNLWHKFGYKWVLKGLLGRDAKVGVFAEEEVEEVQGLA